ncbi:MAG: ketoacyl-ACP synthase III [Treponema sp.]|nr:ketoacyl-ACP synthase III [Treponema sp.]
MKAFIKAVEYYLPEKVLANADIQKAFPDWTEEKIYQKVGIKGRHIAAEDETAADMAQKAAEKLFEKNKGLRERIDFVIFCTQSPDYKLPTSACILQDRLGLSQNVGAFDFNLGCSGYVYGLSIVKGYIDGGMAKNVLLLTGETYSKYIHPQDKSNLSIFGDAASATVVSTEGRLEIGDFAFGTDGGGFEQLIVKAGGARFPGLNSEISVDEDGHIVSGNHLFMDGQSIFSFTLKRIPQLIENTLKKNGLEKKDVDLFIFHQANAFILDYLRKKIGIESERFYYCVETVGNTVSSSIPIALCDALSDGTLIKKKDIMLAGFGVGLSWAGCILKHIYSLSDL